jgi:3-hydroxyacyl-[acyl-carrier-protein] dehydratase
MRFIFVDRIVGAEPGRRIETLKNVSATEDVFADHFPGYPVFPGALVVEAFAQACQLLIAMSHDFVEIGRLEHLSRVAFARPVRPGDQLRIQCERRAGAGAWALDATATVDGIRVATATLEFRLERAAPSTGARRQADRLRALQRELQPAALATAPRGGAAGSPSGADE